MLRFVRRLAYRDRVIEQLSALLVMYPRGRQFADDFPALPTTIRTRFDDGASPAACTAELAGAILGDLLGQLDEVERSAVAERLRNVGAEQFRMLAAQRICERRRDGAADRTSFVAELTGVALYLARRMLEEGTLGAREYEFLAATVDRALAVTAGNAFDPR
jgi:hypothetical protein